MKLSWPLTIVAACTAIGCAAAPAAASADTTWLVNASFTDGTTLTGTFTMNVYGYLESANLQTDTNGVFTGFDYTVGDSNVMSGGVGGTFIDLQPGYTSDLHLEFADSLTGGSPTNPILTDDVSYECQGSFSCFDLGGGNTRFIGEGSATRVPEPATWALALVGFAGLGAAMRGRRRLALA